MKNKKLFLTLIIVIIFICSLIPASYAEVAALGNVIDASVDGTQLILTIDNGSEPNDDSLIIEVCQDNILRVNYQPNSVATSLDTPIIDPELAWDTVDADIDISGNPIVVTSADMRIEIARNPCRMTVKKADGTMLFWEPESGGVFHDGVKFVRAESSNMYGIHGFDCFSDNGYLLRNDNANTASAGQQGDSGGPFMWSTSGYGLLVDSDGGYPYTNSNDRKMEFYYGGIPVEGRRYEKEDVEYYIILGLPEEIMQGFSKITGTSPMMPKWSLGFSNFEWDIDEAELLDMVETYRAKNIPIDSYAFDYDWKQYGDDNYGEFEWNTSNFPSAATTALKASLDDLGIKMIGITKPRIVTKLSNGTPTQQGLDAANSGYFYPGHYEYTDYFKPVTVQSIDPYNASEREWWWEHSENAFDKGIVGWWNDETDKVSSNGADFWFGNFTTLHLSQSIFEGQRKYTNDEARVWQTARNYYPGTQRYGTSLWSGDVATQFYKGERVSWAAGLNEQKADLLSTINNGQPKWGTDGGGFNQNSGSIENPSPELYTRWLQFSSVTPVFRVHGTNYHQRQPWYFGTTAEEVVKAAIHQRYSFIPYMYSYEHRAYATGTGLVTPLLFSYPNDENVANYSDAWMFGDWLLAAPVTEREQSIKWIYLPEGKWYDFNRGTEYTGNQYIPYGLNSESYTDLPMFAKEGAIIPTQDVLDYTDEETIDSLFVHVFPSDQTTTFSYYDDDGESYDYESGEYYAQEISALKNGQTTNINLSAKTGTYVNDLEYYYFAVHNQAGTSAMSNNASLPFVADYNALLDLNGEGWTTGKDVFGTVTFIKIQASTEKAITVAGSVAVNVDSQSYEAEYASLFGNTIAGKSSVNNNHSGYSGTGFVDKFEADGAGLTFYAKVSNGGQYDLSIRYSNGDFNTKSLSVYINGSYSGQALMESTGGWDSWETSIKSVDLAAGNNIITLKYDTQANDTGCLNIDYLEIPFYPSTIYVEAESSALFGSAAKNQNHWYYSGSGFVDGITSSGAGIKFDVDVPASGQYPAVLRFCNGTMATKTLNLYVNGNYQTTLNLNSVSGNWNEWKEMSQTLNLVTGRNTISIQYDSGNSGNVNIDSLGISLLSGNTHAALVDNGGFERNSSQSSGWSEWHPYGQALAYGIDSGSGINKPESPYAGDKRAYFHSSNSYQQSIHQGISVQNGEYLVKAWIQVKNVTPTVGRMEISGYGGNDIHVNMPSTGSGWSLVTTTVSVTSGYIDIGFYCSSPGGTVVHIDSVELIAA